VADIHAVPGSLRLGLASPISVLELASFLLPAPYGRAASPLRGSQCVGFALPAGLATVLHEPGGGVLDAESAIDSRACTSNPRG
jgi:hypothetical protein